MGYHLIVLILIVVDDGLVLKIKIMSQITVGVLILIVVDDGLVQLKNICIGVDKLCLNPYCSGRWSRTFWILLMVHIILSLNPYCSGRWSRTKWN